MKAKLLLLTTLLSFNVSAVESYSTIVDRITNMVDSADRIEIDDESGVERTKDYTFEETDYCTFNLSGLRSTRNNGKLIFESKRTQENIDLVKAEFFHDDITMIWFNEKIVKRTLTIKTFNGNDPKTNESLRYGAHIRESAFGNNAKAIYKDLETLAKNYCMIHPVAANFGGDVEGGGGPNLAVYVGGDSGSLITIAEGDDCGGVTINDIDKSLTFNGNGTGGGYLAELSQGVDGGGFN